MLEKKNKKQPTSGLFERNYALSRMLHGRQKGNHESEQAKTPKGIISSTNLWVQESQIDVNCNHT